MIEDYFVKQKIKEFQIQEYIATQLGKTGYSHTELKRTPLGEKIIIYTTRPGLVVGKKGDKINQMTTVLKKRFKMENPQIEIGDLSNPSLDVSFVADKIVSLLERFGTNRFKSVGYRTLQEIIDAGALGAEIVVSGKVPSSRAKSWRFSAGYLKKSGDIAENKVKKSYAIAQLKTGVIGVKVMIMTPDIILPDALKVKPRDMTPLVEPLSTPDKELQEIIAIKSEVLEEAPVVVKEEKKEKPVKKASPKKAVPKKTSKKKEEVKVEESQEKVTDEN